MPAIYKGKQMDKSTEPCVAHQPYFQEKLKKIFWEEYRMNERLTLSHENFDSNV